MSIKEFAKERVRDFFVITTLVNIVMFLLGTIYQHGMQFSYEAFLMPPIYGFFGTLPSWISYSRKELPMKQLLVRKICQFMILLIVITLITFPRSYYCRENIPMILSFAFSVIVVYFLVMLITWLLDKKAANDIMKDLEMYQQSNI